MAGFDLRLSREFGLGPFVDATIAEYSTVSNTAGDSIDIPRTTVHSWVTVGLRLVLFP